jgi:fibronectin type 3 domain-containing protein
VNVTWDAVGGATSYEVRRRTPTTGGAFPLINSPMTNAYTDTDVTAGNSYLYVVRAVNASTSSPDSTADLATTILFTDDPIVAGTTLIKAVHLAELRNAANAVRTLAGAGTFTFVTGAASAGTMITAAQINEVRTALDGGRGPLGLSTAGYTDTLTAGVTIKAVHFQEIRNRTK